MMELDRIEIETELGDIRFGTSEEEIIELLGSNHLRVVDEEGDIEIEYEELNLRFTFWEDFEFRLGVISVERSTSILAGKPLHGSNQGSD